MSMQAILPGLRPTLLVADQIVILPRDAMVLPLLCLTPVFRETSYCYVSAQYIVAELPPDQE